MRNLLLLIIIGFATYGAYTAWNIQRPVAPREPAQTNAAEQQPAAATQGREPASAPFSEPADVINGIVTFTHQNLDRLLSPIQAQGAQPTFGQLTQLKVSLLSEMRKPHTARATARLNLALQLESVLEQAISQRAENARLLHANEFAEGIEGTSSASKKSFQLSNEEERRRLARTEFWKRGTERKWDDIASQYRATIEKLLVSLAG